MPSSNDNVEALCRDYITLNEEVKRLTALKDTLRKQIGQAMAASDPIRVDEYELGVTMSPGRKTLNKSKLEDALGDLTPFYSTGKPFFTVSYKVVDKVVEAEADND